MSDSAPPRSGPRASELKRIEDPGQANSANDAYTSENVARWLQDVAKRPWSTPAAGEPHAGGSSNSSTALLSLEPASAEAGPTAVQVSVRRSVMMSALALAFLQYYFIDVNLQISKLSSLTIFVPVAPLDKRV